MLEQIRTLGGSWGAKIGAGIIVLVFIFWGYGTQGAGSEDYAAKVNGEKITLEDFENVYRQQQAQVRSQNPNLPSDLQERLLIQRVIDDLVERELLVQFADQVAIHVSPKELAEEIKTLPFLVDEKTGEFIGREKYLEFLEVRDIRVNDFENDIRDGLRVQKAREYIESAVKVTPAEVKEAFRAQNEKVNLSFVEVDAVSLAESMKDRKIPKDEVEAWIAANAGEVERIYAERKESRYTVPATVELLRITVQKPGAAAKDREEALATAQRRADRALEAAAEDWEEAAGEYSQGAPWEKSGNSRSFARRELPAALADEVFRMAPEDPPKLIETPTSFVVARVESSTPEKVTELDETLKQAIVEERIRETQGAEEAERFATEAFDRLKKGESLEKVAASKQLAVKETGLFPHRNEIPGIPDAGPELVAGAFRLEEPGAVLSIDDAPPKLGDAWIVAVLKEHVKPLDEEFEQQKVWVERGLKAQRKQDAFRAWKADQIAKGKIFENPRLLPRTS